jgi:hypothetical protein
MNVILINSQAKMRSKFEQDISKVLSCLGDSDLDVRQAALNAIESFVQYRE